MALRDSSMSQNPNYYQAFHPSGQCTIQGLIFFGTPFKGNMWANFGALVGRVPPLNLLINATTLSYLSVRNKDISSLVEELRLERYRLSLPFLTFYEKKEMGWGIFKQLVGLPSSPMTSRA